MVRSLGEWQQSISSMDMNALLAQRELAESEWISAFDDGRGLVENQYVEASWKRGVVEAAIAFYKEPAEILTPHRFLMETEVHEVKHKRVADFGKKILDVGKVALTFGRIIHS